MLTIPVPVFFNETGVFRGRTLDLDAFALPLSICISIVSMVLFPQLFKSLISYSFLKLIAVPLAWCFIFLLGGIVSGFIDPSLLLIYIAPIPGAIFLGRWLRSNYFSQREMVVNLLSISFFTCSLIALLHILSSYFSYGLIGSFVVRGEDSIFGFFSIYQKLVYYPTLISCYLFLGAGLILQGRRTLALLICYCIIVVDVLIIGSRESILIAFFSILFLLYSRPRKALIFFLIFISLILVLQIVNFNFPQNNDIIFINKWISLAESGNYSAGRLGAMQKVFSTSVDEFNVVFGTFFSMSLGDIRTPHNQYLELFLRSGILGISIFFVMIFGLILNIRYTCRFYHKDFLVKSLAVMLMVFLFVSFNINTPIRAPLTSTLFYTLVAFFYFKPRLEFK